jgi:paraquat-inducible protein B
MSAKASPTLIGLFTLVGLILAAIAVVLFGAGQLFKKTHKVILYFDKSANGLQVGSDVRFGGVRIGSVHSISVLIDTRENRKIIPVVVELGQRELGQIGIEEEGGIDFSTRAGVEKAIQKGLRAGMKQQSLVTGQLYIEFDMLPESPGFVYHPKQHRPEYPVVPTVGTEMDELIAGIGDGIRKFNSLDIETVINELRDLLKNTGDQIAELNMKEINDNVVAITQDVRKITADEKIATAVDNLNKALVQIEELAAKANAGIDPLLEDLETVLARTEESLAGIEKAVDEISGISNPRGPVLLRLQNVLQETERASRALKELSNDLKRDPKALISGKAGEEE